MSVFDKLNRFRARIPSRIELTGVGWKIEQWFGLQVFYEFPQITEDLARIARGEQPSALYRRAGEIYRAAVAADRTLIGKADALLDAVRLAHSQMCTNGLLEEM